MAAASRMRPLRLGLGPGGVGLVPHCRLGSCPDASQWPVGGEGKWTYSRLLCRSCLLVERAQELGHIPLQVDPTASGGWQRRHRSLASAACRQARSAYDFEASRHAGLPAGFAAQDAIGVRLHSAPGRDGVAGTSEARPGMREAPRVTQQ